MGLRDFLARILGISPTIRVIEHQQIKQSLEPREYTPSEISNILGSTDIARKVRLAELVELRDPVIRSQLQIRKLSIISKKWQILPADKTPQAQEQADFITNLFNSWDFDDFCLGLQDAILKGFSVYRIPRWELRNGRKIPVEPEFINQTNFYYDVRTGKLQFFTPQYQRLNVEDYPDYFILHTFEGSTRPLIMSGLVHNLAWLWCFETFIIKFWLIRSELFSTPLRLGYFDKLATQDDINILKKAVQDIGIDYYAVLPQSTKIEFLSAGGNAEAGASFSAFIELMRKQKAIVILGQTASMEGTPGRLGAEQERARVRQDILESDCRREAQTINALIRRIIDKNFAVPLYPKFERDYKPPEDLNLKADLILKLQKAGFTFTKEYISQQFGVPIPEEGEHILVPAFGMKEQKAGLILREPSKPTSENEEAIPDKMKEAYRKALSQLLGHIDFKTDINTINPDELAEKLSPIINAVVLNGFYNGFCERLRKYQKKKKAYKFQEEEELYIPKDTAEMFYVIDHKALDYLSKVPFYASRIASREALRRIQEELESAISEGLTMKEWKERLAGIIDNLSEVHQATIFRTNLATARAYGQYESNKVLGDRLWGYRYRTAGDDRVRPEHQALEGYTAPKDDPFWRTHTPPLDFNCRCFLEEIFDYEAPEEWDAKPVPRVGFNAPDRVGGGYPWETAIQYMETRLKELGGM